MPMANQVLVWDRHRNVADHLSRLMGITISLLELNSECKIVLYMYLCVVWNEI
jgi:hypothetical protein